MGRLAVLLIGVLLSGCETQRNGVRCIGVADDPEPGVRYEASIRNVVIGIILVETVVVPAVVLLGDLRCPVQKTNEAPK